MYRKIYSILLLLSFLVLVSHQLMHHHHEKRNVVLSGYQKKVHNHSHNGEENHNHYLPINEEKDKKQSCNDHDFPQHCHVFELSEIYSPQINKSRLFEKIIKPATLVLVYFINTELDDPPDLNYVCTDFPFLIKPLFNPQTIVLRGPPIV